MYDVAIIGGGIIGLSTGYSLIKKYPNLKVIIIEKENSLGVHQTGHNSGVIHSGIYYKPGSLKAQNCRLGMKLLIDYCSINNIKFEICGKLIIANTSEEIKTLLLLESRGIKNGIKGLKRLSSSEIREYEPHANGLSALYVPETGIVNYLDICDSLSSFIREKSEILTGNRVIDIVKEKGKLHVLTNHKKFNTKIVINCAGLFSDKIAKLVNSRINICIVPFRGEYFKLKKEKRFLVRNLIYPVPNPKYPFLGVHFTRSIGGDIEAGPNAVLAFAREGYSLSSFSIPDMWSYLSFPGFWRMAMKYYSIAFNEYYRSFFKQAFVEQLRRLVPEIKSEDLLKAPAGVRAQALALDGKLLDDFIIDRHENIINVLNAPSPAATSALAIGRKILSLYDQK